MIGVFDSGSGGLGVLFEIRKRMPKVDVVYLGDIKNAPYGTKSREELGALTTMAVSRLLKEGVGGIVSACNSVSASIVLPMLDILGVKPFDIVEMVGPTVKGTYQNEGILLVATPTVGREIDCLAISDLAGAIEFGATDDEIEKIILRSLDGKIKPDHQQLLLCCTHYPLVKNLFEKVLRSMNLNLDVSDPAIFVADEVSRRMKDTGSSKTKFMITKDSELFRARVNKMFGTQDIIVEVLDD